MEEYALRSAYRKLKFLNDEVGDRKKLFVDYEKDFMRVVKIAQGNIRVNQDHARLKKNIEEAAEFQAKKREQEALHDQLLNDSTPDVPQKKLYRKMVEN